MSSWLGGQCTEGVTQSVLGVHSMLCSVPGWSNNSSSCASENTQSTMSLFCSVSFSPVVYLHCIFHWFMKHLLKKNLRGFFCPLDLSPRTHFPTANQILEAGMEVGLCLFIFFPWTDHPCQLWWRGVKEIYVNVSFWTPKVSFLYCFSDSSQGGKWHWPAY